MLFILSALNSKSSDVYICRKQGAKKYYFSENCRGLNNRKHEIFKTSAKAAQNLALEIYDWEN